MQPSDLHPAATGIGWMSLLVAIVAWANAVPLPALDLGPDPTGEEIECLEWANRMRADPAAHVDELLRGGRLGFAGARFAIDWDLCRREIAALPPAPPLVMNRHLVHAARKHAVYMATHLVTGHFQAKGQKAFYGVHPAQRMRRSGYRGRPTGENSFMNATTPLNAHRGFAIDWGDGPGDLLPGRGHRLSLVDPRSNEVGIGISPHHQYWLATTQDFGRSDAPRLAGGVVYRDLDRNGRFDAGEGIGDVAIEIGGVKTRTWASGGYALSLPHTDACTAVATADDNEHRTQIPEGGTSIKFDWVVPQEGDTAALQRLLAAAEEAPAGDAGRPERLACLVLAPRHAPPSTTRAHIARLCATERDALHAAHDAVRRSLYWQGDAECRRVVAPLRQNYADTAAESWFVEALQVSELYWTATAFLDKARTRRPVGARDQRTIHRKARHLGKR
ncbi:MAG: CAP domain-containing protein, partial [Planctomycetota bacterium]